jgi:TRAP-type uncharacterized transport system substrate-binding protein
MHRRALLRAGLVVAALVAASAHTPYRHWQVYRQKHLLIGTSRADAPTYPLGQRIAEVLATHLPESSARVARGRTPMRLASLLTTGQFQIVLFSNDDLVALRDGGAPFEAFGPTELCALFRFGQHWLVTRPDFPDHHAWLVVRTLTEQAEAIDAAAPALAGECPVPVHPGALAYAAGEPLPPAPDLPDHDHHDDHDHRHQHHH